VSAISWPDYPDSMDESEQKQAIDDIQARRISVGGAYRRLYFMPDVAVLWQIGRRKVAVALAGLYALAAIAIVTVVVVGSLLPVGLAIGILIVLGGVVVVADIAVVVALEYWVEEYNASLDQEIRRIMGRSRE
jgi:Flp pilus assembly protein TadB